MGPTADKIWRQALLSQGSNFQQAIKNLDQTAIKIALVIDKDSRLLGTVSDGDIRRGLLRGMTLDSSIETIIQRHPLVVPPGMTRETVLQLMQINKIQQLPILDEDRRVVGIHLWDDLSEPKERSNQMIIMAGGLGKRLRPHTESCPKPLLPIAGKPILQHIIERARLEGFCRFVFAIHYLGEMIEEHFGDGTKFDVEIKYLREETPLGTAGAVSLLQPRPDLPFIVSNGDVLTDIRYGELLDFHLRHDACATMAVRLHEWQHPFGVVHTKGIEIVGFEEKPISRTHVNAGVYALHPEALDSLQRNTPCDMPTLFEHLKSRSKRTVAYPMHEPWLDVGRPEDLEFANTSIDQPNKG
jgi:dTDP-glucose pyrophosphorylase